MATTEQHDSRLRPLSDVVRVLGRVMLPVALAVLVGGVLLIALLVIYARLIGEVGYAQLVTVVATPEAATAAVLGLILPIVLLFLLAALVWGAVVVQRAGAALGGERVPLGRAALRGLVRAPKAALVVLIVVLAVILAIALSPLILLAGIVGLIVAAARRPERWPSRRTLITMAIPLGFAAHLVTSWALALPSVWLVKGGIRAAFRDSAARAKGQQVAIGITLLLSAAITWVVTEGLATVASMLELGAGGEVVARAVALIVIGPLVLVAMTVRYFRGGPVPAPQDAVGAPARRMRTAIAVSVALVVPLAVTSAPAPALAVGTEAVTHTVFLTNEAPLAGEFVNVVFRVRNAANPEGTAPTGTLSITIDGVPQAIAELGPGGSGYLITQAFDAGSHTIESTYSGDDLFAPATAEPLVFTVGASTSVSLSTTDESGIYSKALKLTAAVSGSADPTGSVEFSATPAAGGDVTVLGTVPVSSGSAAYDVTDLLPGNWVFTAQYLGDGTNPAAVSNGIQLRIDPATTQTTFTITPPSPTPAGVGLVAHVTVVNVDGNAVPRGEVLMLLDGQGDPIGRADLDATGQADVDFDLDPGVLQRVVAYFEPDPGFLSSHLDESHTVAPFESGVLIESDDPSTVFGESAGFTATVIADGVPTGEISFEAKQEDGTTIDLGTRNLVAGAAHLTTDVLPVGAWKIVAHYGGDGANDAADSGPLAHTVGKASVVVDVESNLPAPTVGDSGQFRVEVTAHEPGEGLPTGTVTLKLGATTLDSAPLDFEGKATLEADIEHGGTQTYTVEYSGDGNFGSGSGTEVLEVARMATTTTLLDLDEDSYSYGEPITFKGGVSFDGGFPVTSGTVRLLVGGAAIEEQEVVNGQFTFVVDDIPVGSSPTRNVWVEYLDDDPDFRGSDTTANLIQLGLVKASVVPLISASPDELGVGGTVTLTATLDALGAGPTGTVTFQTTDTVPVVLATDTSIVDGVASGTFTMPSSRLDVVAVYSGDSNFQAVSSGTLVLTADRVAAIVTLDDPGPLAFGTTNNVTANVTLGGNPVTTGMVTFKAAGNDYLVNLSGSGVATLKICAGSAGDCADGVPLGRIDSTITASYPDTEVNLGGVSSAVNYTLSKAATTVTVTTQPTPTLIQGTLVYLTATVDATGIPANPTGSVSFYALTPRDDGGHDETLLAVDDTVENGVAEANTTVKNALDQLRWPADGVIARYFPVGPFEGSNGSVPITIQRQGLTLRVLEPVVIPGEDVGVTIDFQHEAGVSDDYEQRVQLFVDGVLACQQFVPSGTQNVRCTIDPLSTGQHTLTAHYPGDTVYLPADSDPLTVGAGKGNPTFGARVVDDPVIAGQTVTVRWTIDAGATGTVRVFADGPDWCTVDVAVGECSGTFAQPTAPGEFAQVHLQYSGDDTWNQAGIEARATVLACAIVDVTTPTSSLGTVAIHTAPNCGSTGYRSGTTITVTATPTAPNEFVRWEKLSGPGFVFASDQLTTTFVVTTDSTTWVHRAIFFEACYPVGATPSGYGRIGIVQDPNCTTRAGEPGYRPGTRVTVFPVPEDNPAYLENDAFIAWGALPPGASTRADSVGAFATFLVNGPVDIPIVFGPQCRTVVVLVAPSTPGDRNNVETPRNCDSPTLFGYTRFTNVTVTADSGDTGRILASWSVNGVVRPELGRERRVTVMLDSLATVITANYLSCYPLDLRLDSGDYQGNPYGQVTIDVPPNCPDGSQRYIEGTKVTLTPEVLYKGVQFTGFDELGRFYQGTGPEGVGVIASKVKIVTIARGLVVNAGFYRADSCSKLTIKGDPSLIDFPNNGCGAGYYFDLQKQEALRIGIGQRAAQAQDFKLRSQLYGVIPGDVPMDVYLTITGDTKNCFGEIGNHQVPGEPKTYGPLQRPNTSCDVGGDLVVTVQQCQTIQNLATFHVAGGSPTYTANDLPSQLYLKDSKGNIGAWGMDDFRWVDSSAVQVVGDGFGMIDIPAGPCQSAGNAFPAGQDVAVFATSPSTGIVFQGWRDLVDDGSLLDSNPIIRTTDATRKMPNTAEFTITCHHLEIGTGVTVVEPAPYCPGSDPASNSYIAGTAVQVKAVQHVDDRALIGFEGDIQGSQITKDDATGEHYGYVYMDGDKHVWGYYPTDAQSVGLAVAKAFKIVAGIAAVALPIVAGIAFPGVGLVLGMLAAASGIASMIPGGDKAAAIFDLVDPTNITNCAARWAFNTAGDPTGGYNVGGLLGTANKLNDIRQGKDVLTFAVKDLRALPVIGKKLPAKIANIPGGLTYGLGAATFAYGLYDAGIGNVTLEAQTVQGLRDTSTMTNCLDDQWRAAGSDISGNDSEEKAPDR